MQRTHCEVYLHPKDTIFFSEGKEFVTAVISMLIGSVKSQSDHTSKMDQLYSLWCQSPNPITESEPRTMFEIKQTTVTVENMIITTDKSEVGEEKNSKSGLEDGRYEEVHQIIVISAPIISISVLLILFVLLFQTCKGVGSSKQIQKIQILPVSAEGEIFYQQGSKGKTLGTLPYVVHP